MIDMAGNLDLGYEQYRRIEHGDVLVKTEYLIAMASIFRYQQIISCLEQNLALATKGYAI